MTGSKNRTNQKTRTDCDVNANDSSYKMSTMRITRTDRVVLEVSDAESDQGILTSSVEIHTERSENSNRI